MTYSVSLDARQTGGSWETTGSLGEGAGKGDAKLLSRLIVWSFSSGVSGPTWGPAGPRSPLRPGLPDSP